jgi:hypothetical protein
MSAEQLRNPPGSLLECSIESAKSRAEGFMASLQAVGRWCTWVVAALIASGLLAGCGGSDGPGTDTGTVLFLHHSTGEAVWNGGVEAWFEDYNAAEGTSYAIQQTPYPDEPYPWENYPYDYWNLWVDHAGTSRYEGQETLDMLAKRYELIVFKHCFPVSMVEQDTGNPDISSSTRSLANYKLQYQAIKTKLRSFPDKQFLVWTGAALTETALTGDYGGTLAHAARARQFFTWVKEVWDEPGDNIFVFDFFELETEGGDTLLESYAEAPSDPHPNAAFAQTVAPRFARRVVDVLEGRGDTGSLTGD